MLNYLSTRSPNKIYSLPECLLQGLAPDGGLFIPQTFPTIDIDACAQIKSYSDFCQEMLVPFFRHTLLESHLPSICQKAFNFELPLRKITANTYILELFHGPTLSFKDIGARFLAGCLSALTTQKLTIMVATSGDTGSAVAAAFHQQPKIKVIILFPYKKISPSQQAQITCWGDNIRSYAVEGTFDDCQRLVKQAFKASKGQLEHQLCTANSINLGRLLPQMGYYAYTSLAFFQQQQIPANFIVPSGNLGNVTAAFWAQKLGFPIKRISIATNANKVIPHYFATGSFEPQHTIATLANAMDVGNPSNMERLIHFFKENPEQRKQIHVESVADIQIQHTIKKVYEDYHYLLCPHTATAWCLREQLDDEPWIIASTAHPAKFEQVIEPIIQKPIPPEPKLAAMLKRPQYCQRISAELQHIL